MPEPALTLDLRQPREPGRTRDRVAAERRAVVTLLQRVSGRPRRQTGPDRQSTAEPLRQGHDVRTHVVVLVGEPGARPPDAALHLVQDEQRTVTVARLAGSFEITGGRRH